MKKIFTLFVVLCLSYLTMGASTPKHEFRATWLTTAWGNLLQRQLSSQHHNIGPLSKELNGFMGK